MTVIKDVCGRLCTCYVVHYALGLAVLLVCCGPARAQWRPVAGPLMTRWAKEVTPDNVHSEYPRPQMVREKWLTLNGLWEYAIRPKDQPQPESFDGQILVPFGVESALSGVMKTVGEENRLWYRRGFEVPAQWKGKRVHLNFGAVDWETTVWVNGKKIGAHRGGYDSFTFDITDALMTAAGQEVVISVWDPTDAGAQPRGKQVRKPDGIWYTAVTGIWQTVWLEPVGEAHISSLKIVTDIEAELVRITPQCSADAIGAGLRVEVEARGSGFTTGRVAAEVGREIVLAIDEAKLWSPDSPYLYELSVRLTDSTGAVQYDSIESYFGMRKVSIGKDKAGINRLFLNNRPLFQYGPLDQGWWPDGLYTAPTDEALRYDVEVLKRLGCNMMRKHVKVEPLRFYYLCDKLGMLVWQDMPNGDRHIRPQEPDIERTAESAQQFEFELSRLIEAHRNHPCIVMWVPFNEGWGQYDTGRIVKLIKRLDPTRLVDNASGWSDRRVGDVHDVHSYPGPDAPPNELGRASVLGEFGGLGLPLKEHTWQDEKNWGYRRCDSREELTEAYLALIGKLGPLVEEGLSAAVYTQTADTETEVNGLMTYDREIIKPDADKITEANKGLYGRLSW